MSTSAVSGGSTPTYYLAHPNASTNDEVSVVQDLLGIVVELGEHPEVQKDNELLKVFDAKAEALFNLTGSSKLNSENQTFYRAARQLISNDNKINTLVRNLLLKSATAENAPQIAPAVMASASVQAASASPNNPPTPIAAASSSTSTLHPAMQRHTAVLNWKAKPKLLAIECPKGTASFFELKDGTLVTASGNIFKLWSQDGRCLQTLEGPIDKGEKKKHQHFIELQDGTIVIGFGGSFWGGLWHAYVNPFVVMNDGSFATAADTTFKVWDRSGRCLATVEGKASLDELYEWSTEGPSKLIRKDVTGAIKLWNREGSCLQTFDKIVGNFTLISKLKDGTIVSAQKAHESISYTISLWRRDGTCLQTFNLKDMNCVEFLELTDGCLACRDSLSNHFIILSRDGTSQQTFKGHTDHLSYMLELKNGIIVTGAFDYTIKLWSRDGRCIKTIDEKIFMGRIMVLRDGSFVSISNKTVKIWDQDGTCMKNLKLSSDWIGSFIELSDGTLASSHNDGTFKLWDRKGNCLQTLKGHKNKCSVSLLELDNGTLASRSDDNTVKLWTFPVLGSEKK